MDRFWEKVDIGTEGECWEWQAGGRGTGYGAIKVDGEVIDSHRMAWELTQGEIPEGLFVCHHCDNRSCCNPKHLFLGTRSDNMKDAYEKGRLEHLDNIRHQPKGNKNGMSKLSKNEVESIKTLIEDSSFSQSDIADIFDVHKSRITRIKNGESWSHVE